MNTELNKRMKVKLQYVKESLTEANETLTDLMQRDGLLEVVPIERAFELVLEAQTELAKLN